MYDSSDPVSIAPPKHVDEQQHQRDRGDRGGDDRVGAAQDVAQRAAGQDAGVAEDVGGHRGSFPARPRRRCGRRCCRSRSRRCRRRGRGRRPRGRAASRRIRPVAGGSSCLSSARVPFWMIVPLCRIAIRSASCSASSRYCVVSSTVVPWPASRLMVCHTSMRAWGSSPVVGSSRKMTGGFPIRLIAMSSRRRMPPE